MDDTLIKLHIFLDTCYEIENSCAEMYSLFSQQFTADIKISRLWSKTAMEEENHARHVLLAKKMVHSINWVCLESWRNAASAVDMVRQFSSSVRESPPTLCDAILMALECEYRMENLHMQSAILVKERAGNSMFMAMMKEDRGHIIMLEKALVEMQKKKDDEIDADDFEELEPLDIMEWQPAAVKYNRHRP